VEIKTQTKGVEQMEKPRHVEVAEEIARQLGGANKLRMAIGARDIFADTAGRGALRFKFPGAGGRKPNFCKITLEDSDTYTVYTCRIRAGKVLDEQTETDIYAEDLVTIIEKMTGLYFSIWGYKNDAELAAITGRN
jgi:hypothetical protein